MNDIFQNLHSTPTTNKLFSQMMKMDTVFIIIEVKRIHFTELYLIFAIHFSIMSKTVGIFCRFIYMYMYREGIHILYHNF